MNNITIVGAGTMGHALAQVFAQGGYHVFLNDVSEEILKRARRLIASNLETLCEAGLLDKDKKHSVLEERISFTTELSTAVATSELIIEAIIEDQEAKKTLFSELDRLSPAEAILASNTSYLDIYQFRNQTTGKSDNHPLVCATSYHTLSGNCTRTTYQP